MARCLFPDAFPGCPRVPPESRPIARPPSVPAVGRPSPHSFISPLASGTMLSATHGVVTFVVMSMWVPATRHCGGGHLRPLFLCRSHADPRLQWPPCVAAAQGDRLGVLKLGLGASRDPVFSFLFPFQARAAVTESSFLLTAPAMRTSLQSTLPPGCAVQAVNFRRRL